MTEPFVTNVAQLIIVITVNMVMILTVEFVHAHPGRISAVMTTIVWIVATQHTAINVHMIMTAIIVKVPLEEFTEME